MTGSFSRTAINAQSGAQSPLSTAIAAMTVVVVLLFLTPLLAFLPKPAVSAIVLSAVARLIDFEEYYRLFVNYKEKGNNDVVIYTAVLFVSLFWRAEFGILIGIILSRFISIESEHHENVDPSHRDV